MQDAKRDLINNNEEQVSCKCIYKGRSAHCQTFKYSNKHVSDYSVYDLARIGASKKTLEYLVNTECLNIEDIPETFKLSDSQTKQVHAYKHGARINVQAIKREL